MFRDGVIVPLPPKGFELLLIFICNRGHALTKEELIHKLWADTFVEEANLAQNISVLRKALGESAGEPQFVVTIPRYGYRFIATVRETVTPIPTETLQPAIVQSRNPTSIILRELKTAGIAASLAAALVPAAACYGSSLGRSGRRTNRSPTSAMLRWPQHCPPMAACLLSYAGIRLS